MPNKACKYQAKLHIANHTRNTITYRYACQTYWNPEIGRWHYEFRFRTFDCATGREIQYEHIINEENRKKIGDLILEKLLAQLKPGDAFADEFPWWPECQEHPSEHFTINKEGIVFYYEPGHLRAGDCDVHIPYHELETLVPAPVFNRFWNP